MRWMGIIGGRNEGWVVAFRVLIIRGRGVDLIIRLGTSPPCSDILWHRNEESSHHTVLSSCDFVRICCTCK